MASKIPSTELRDLVKSANLEHRRHLRCSSGNFIHERRNSPDVNSLQVFTIAKTINKALIQISKKDPFTVNQFLNCVLRSGKVLLAELGALLQNDISPDQLVGFPDQLLVEIILDKVVRTRTNINLVRLQCAVDELAHKNPEMLVSFQKKREQFAVELMSSQDAFLLAYLRALLKEYISRYHQLA